MKLLAGKLALFLLLLLAGQMVFATFYPAEVPSEILTFQKHLEDGVEILYFGDSILWDPPGSQTIPEMLQELLPDSTVGEVSHAAYNMDLYAGYVSALVRYENHPKLVVIPINMRSFSPEWDRRPGYQFEEEKAVLRYGVTAARLFGKPYAVFGGYKAGISNDDFWQTPVFNGEVAIGRVKDFEEQLGNTLVQGNGGERFIYYQQLPEAEQMQDMLIYYYMYSLEPEHRKVRAMLEIVDTLQQNGIDVLFYITPVNEELGDVYVGDAFRRQFTRNITLIKSLLAERGVPVLDLAFDLAAFNFSDTEHLRPDGKYYVASRIAEEIEPELTIVPREETTPLPVPTSTPPSAPPSATPSMPHEIPDNPLLATAQARATTAAGGELPEEAEGTPTPPPVQEEGARPLSTHP